MAKEEKKEVYEVVSDINFGQHQVGSEIELTAAEAAKIPHAVKLKKVAAAERRDDAKILKAQEEADEAARRASQVEADIAAKNAEKEAKAVEDEEKKSAKGKK